MSEVQKGQIIQDVNKQQSNDKVESNKIQRKCFIGELKYWNTAWIDSLIPKNKSGILLDATFTFISTGPRTAVLSICYLGSQRAIFFNNL